MKRPIKHTRAREPEAIEFARDQRARANEFSKTVWQWVRNRQMCRQKFRREYPVPPYTADFCCVELRLILEIDGAEHLTESGQEHDRVRDMALLQKGYRVVRIAGYDVMEKPERTRQRIEDVVRERMREIEGA